MISKQIINHIFPNLHSNKFCSLNDNKFTQIIDGQTKNELHLNDYQYFDISPCDEKILTSLNQNITIYQIESKKTQKLEGKNASWDYQGRLFYQRNNNIYCFHQGVEQLIYKIKNDGQFYLTKNRKYFVVQDEKTYYLDLVNLSIHHDNFSDIHLEEFAINHSFIENQEGKWIVLVDNQIFTRQENEYQPLFPYNPHVKFQKLEAFKTFLVFWVEINNDNFIWIYKDKLITPIQNLDLAYQLKDSINLDYSSRYYRYLYQSPLTPPTLIEFDTVTNNSTILESQTFSTYQQNDYRMSTIQLPESKKSVTVLKSKDLLKAVQFKFRSRSHQFNLDNINQVDKDICLVLADQTVEEECLNYLKNNLF